ncbi:MAG: thermonuclease family protein [Solirubrobacterales bacterium]
MGLGEQRHGWLGSAVLVVLVAALLLRPWESLGGADAAGPASARVVVERVVDGDTIEVELDGVAEDVRYIGVDTPETVKPESPVECFGPRASNFNHRLVEGRLARLVFGVERRDVYGRLLAYVYLDRRFVNAELLRRGFARTLTIAPNDRYAERFKRLEIAAARHGRGLWGACES